MQFQLIAAGADGLYLESLIQFLILSDRQQFHIYKTDSEDGLLEAFDHNSGALCLLEESFFQALSQTALETLGKRVVVLTEKITKVTDRHICRVLKYQKASAIRSILVDRFRHFSDGEMVNKGGHRTVFMGFYSPSGGLGTSTVAQMASIAKGRRGSKVLFLSLDTYQTHDLVFSAMEQTSLSDYMAYMLTHDNWLLGLEAMVCRDRTYGVDYFRAVLNQGDILDFPWSLWSEWMTYMASASDYDYIIVDWGKIDSRVVPDLMNRCHARVFITAGHGSAVHKWQLFKSQLKQMDQDGLVEKSMILGTALMGSDYHGPWEVMLPLDRGLMSGHQPGEVKLNLSSPAFKKVEEVFMHV